VRRGLERGGSGGRYRSAVIGRRQNTGSVKGADIPQVYLTSAAGEGVFRLIGFQRIELEPGERRTVTLSADRRLLGWFDEEHRRWQVKRGSYQVRIGKSAGELLIGGDAVIAAFSENLWH
jgi:beta-glucosidase